MAGKQNWGACYWRKGSLVIRSTEENMEKRNGIILRKSLHGDIAIAPINVN